MATSVTTDASDSLQLHASSNTVTKRKKSFYAEEEDIVVKPSTELIPDEYEHVTNDSILFHIFRVPPGEELADDFLECLKGINNTVNTGHIHGLNTIKQFREDLEAIKKECESKSALVLLFIGYFGTEDGTLLMLDETENTKEVHVREIWNMFTSNNCPALKYKPKVFIFCTSPKVSKSIQIDSVPHRIMSFDKVYDFPAEADILIVYKKTEDTFSTSNEHFLTNLCYGIQNHSKKYDIIDLISYINNESQRSVPMIISTLTRKLYLTPNKERDHYFAVVENHTYLEETLENLQGTIENLHEVQKKRKLFSFSFRKKSEEKPKVDKKEKPKVIPPKAPTSPKSPAPSSGNADGHRLSGSSVVYSSGRRLRSTSETDSKRPPWR